MHFQIPGVHKTRRSRATSMKTHFSVLSPPQCQSQAVVCISILRMYPRSGYFSVPYKTIPCAIAVSNCLCRGNRKLSMDSEFVLVFVQEIVVAILCF